MSKNNNKDKTMCAEKNNGKKRRTFAVGCCDGTFEMIKDCFPDDAGYSDCLARMRNNRRKFCGRNDGDSAERENKGCCE
jgi:hypothetical protein